MCTQFMVYLFQLYLFGVDDKFEHVLIYIPTEYIRIIYEIVPYERGEK